MSSSKVVMTRLAGGSMQRYGVRPSVCLFHHSAAAAACGGFAAEGPAGRIYRSTAAPPGAAAARRSAAKASGVTLSADVDLYSKVVVRKVSE